MGPCAHKQMRFILVITNRFSKKIHTLGYKKMLNTKEIISFIMGSINKEWGELKGIVSDQGSQFRSSEWKQFVSQNDIVQRGSSVYHPETDGQSERSIQSLSTKLRIYPLQSEKDYPSLLKEATKAINNAWNKSTEQTPNNITDKYKYKTEESNRDSKQILNWEMINLVKQKLEETKKDMKITTDKSRRKEFPIRQDDQVYVINFLGRKQHPKSFDRKYLGPYTVTKMITPLTFQLHLPEHMSRCGKSFHITHLKRKA
jgi:hypothetical protein